MASFQSYPRIEFTVTRTEVGYFARNFAFRMSSSGPTLEGIRADLKDQLSKLQKYKDYPIRDNDIYLKIEKEVFYLEPCSGHKLVDITMSLLKKGYMYRGLKTTSNDGSIIVELTDHGGIWYITNEELEYYNSLSDLPSLTSPLKNIYIIRVMGNGHLAQIATSLHIKGYLLDSSPGANSDNGYNVVVNTETGLWHVSDTTVYDILDYIEDVPEFKTSNP